MSRPPVTFWLALARSYATDNACSVAQALLYVARGSDLPTGWTAPGTGYNCLTLGSAGIWFWNTAEVEADEADEDEDGNEFPCKSDYYESFREV